jgi:GDPmannose 4,6-dehydratase
MLQEDEPDDYVIATGERHTVREFLDLAFAQIGVDDWTPHVQEDRRFIRPAEVDLLVGDASRARERLGWKPRVGFVELVKMMVTADLEEEADRRR